MTEGFNPFGVAFSVIGKRMHADRDRIAELEAALRATRQILAEYESDPVLQIQAEAIDKILG